MQYLIFHTLFEVPPFLNGFRFGGWTLLSLNVPVPYAILATQVTVDNLTTCNMVTLYYYILTYAATRVFLVGDMKYNTGHSS